MKDNRIKLGRKAEKEACKLLKKRGYKIITRNYEIREGEIDIIVRKGETIVFVEVRSKSLPIILRPVETITTTKQKKIIFTAKDFVNKHKLQNLTYRFDVVSVVFDAGIIIEIEHIENAFTPKNQNGFL